MLLDVRPDHLESVRGILQRLVPDREVWAFGSRSKWTARDTSDLDLCIVGDTPLGFKRLGQLGDAFSESSLPYKVDVVDWATTSESFRKIIERDKVVVQRAGPSSRMAVSEWAPIRLGDVCTKIGSGATPRGGSDVYLQDGPYALIRSQNVYNDGFHHDGLAFIDEKHAAELENVKVLDDDVLLNITGDSVARACQVDPGVLPARVNQHVAIIRPDPGKLAPRFLRYVLVSREMQTKLLSWAGSGGTRNALTKGMIESFDVLAPTDVAEQRAIAHILGTLDDKIELNRRMNETLEAMARALFKSWFVDFDPVRTKQPKGWVSPSGRNPPDKTDGGLRDYAANPPYELPPHIADLFPARLVDSELGEIPEGWGVKPVGDLAEVVGGSTPSTKELAYWDNGYHHWATPKDLSALTVPALLDTERRVTDAGLAQISSGLLAAGTVLLSSRAPIGYLAVSEIPVAINQGFIAMQPKKDVSNLFLLLWASFAHDEILSRANGSTFLEISKANFRPISVIAPPAKVMKAFDQQVRRLYERIVESERQSRALATLRNILLPKLISGEIRVTDAGKTAEAAA